MVDSLSGVDVTVVLVPVTVLPLKLPLELLPLGLWLLPTEVTPELTLEPAPGLLAVELTPSLTPLFELPVSPVLGA